MIFSEKHCFVFFANPKAASTSIEKALAPYDDGERYPERTLRKSFAEYFTPESAELVHQLWREHLEAFGYDRML